jgi:hypothetical protein
VPHTRRRGCLGQSPSSPQNCQAAAVAMQAQAECLAASTLQLLQSSDVCEWCAHKCTKKHLRQQVPCSLDACMHSSNLTGCQG